MDELIILGSTLSCLELVKEKIHSLIKIKDLGGVKYYLGISLERNVNMLFLHQAA